jgi:hypothetical protein
MIGWLLSGAAAAGVYKERAPIAEWMRSNGLGWLGNLLSTPPAPNNPPATPSGTVPVSPGSSVGTALGPSTATGQTYNYTGTIQPTVQQAAQALAAVDPTDPKNVMLVRAFEAAAGLTVDGQTDGRYGSNCEAMLSEYVQNAPPAPAAPLSWWGPPGTYTNPANPNDTGP